MKGATTYLTCILGLLAAFAFAAYTWLPDAALTGDVTRIVQASVTAVAIAAGGVFAAFKLQVFRDFAPHVTITHDISHRPVGDSYVHIAVTANLHNSSRVRMDFRKGLFRLQQIGPMTDHEVENLYAQVFISKEQTHLQWPTLDEIAFEWDQGELMVEPGESQPETYEFIVSAEVKSVVVYTYFFNSGSSRFSPAPGWGRATIYDIINDN